MNPISNRIVGFANLFHKFAKTMTQKQVVMTVSSLALVGVIALVICSFGQSQSGRTFGPKEILTTAVEITVKPVREPSQHPKGLTFPAGSPVRILRNDGPNAVILIGDTKEQAIVPKTAIVEAGGTAGEAITAKSIQWPTEVSTVRTDGPEGIWTGIATGDEDIASSSLAIERQILALTNAERTKRGLVPLTWDEDLARAARYQAADMYVQDYHPADHVTMDVFTKHGDKRYIIRDDDRARFKRFAPYANGENTQARRNDSTAATLVQGWMKSPGHRANILEPRFRRMGVGYVTSNIGAFDWAYSVQVFSGAP